MRQQPDARCLLRGDRDRRSCRLGPRADQRKAGRADRRLEGERRSDRLCRLRRREPEDPHDEALTRRCFGHAKNEKRNAFFHIFTFLLGSLTKFRKVILYIFEFLYFCSNN